MVRLHFWPQGGSRAASVDPRLLGVQEEAEELLGTGEPGRGESYGRGAGDPDVCPVTQDSKSLLSLNCLILCNNKPAEPCGLLTAGKPVVCRKQCSWKTAH